MYCTSIIVCSKCRIVLYTLDLITRVLCLFQSYFWTPRPSRVYDGRHTLTDRTPTQLGWVYIRCTCVSEYFLAGRSYKRGRGKMIFTCRRQTSVCVSLAYRVIFPLDKIYIVKIHDGIIWCFDVKRTTDRRCACARFLIRSYNAHDDKNASRRDNATSYVTDWKRVVVSRDVVGRPSPSLMDFSISRLLSSSIGTYDRPGPDGTLGSYV